jgi:hypothetical protein
MKMDETYHVERVYDDLEEYPEHKWMTIIFVILLFGLFGLLYLFLSNLR